MKTIFCIIAALTTGGCVSVQYTDSIGRKFSYSAPAFGNKAIKRVDLTNGVMEGYSSDQSQMVDFLRSIYEDGRRAGASGIKP